MHSQGRSDGFLYKKKSFRSQNSDQILVSLSNCFDTYNHTIIILRFVAVLIYSRKKCYIISGKYLKNMDIFLITITGLLNAFNSDIFDTARYCACEMLMSRTEEGVGTALYVFRSLRKERLMYVSVSVCKRG